MCYNEKNLLSFRKGLYMNNQCYFMHFYMYELENFLNSKKDALLEISFQSDEANTDRPLKEFLKLLIENEFNMLPKNSILNNICINERLYSIEPYFNYKIKRVLLPEELTDELKQILKETKTSIYTNPDICLEIEVNNQIFYETIELKSTKNDSIPGSSIQQIIPTEWVIFIKHTLDNIEIVTGQYINSINSKIQFPDRSPRPQVSFKELNTWNNIHRNIEDNNLVYYIDNTFQEKLALIYDWQSVLSQRWINILFEDKVVRKNEPWFNNNIRKFILDFLKIYDNLNEQEKIKFKCKICLMIKKETD